MKTLLVNYIKEYEGCWSESTIKSRQCRLGVVLTKYANILEKPALLATRLEQEGKKLYTIKTTFIELNNFYDYLLERGTKEGINPYKKFLKLNRRFKNAYSRKSVDLDYEEAKQRISEIPNKEIQEKAEYLLKTGLRISEVKLVRDGYTTGKGSKKRQVYINNKATYTSKKISYRQLCYALKKVGINSPHDLRKIHATHLLRSGMDNRTVCELMGWASIEMAMIYAQPLKDKEIKKRLEEIL